MGGFGVSTCSVGCQIVDVLLSSGEDVIRWTGQCWEEPRNLSLWMLVDHWVMDRFQLAQNKMDLPMMALMSPQYGNATLAGEWKMLQWLTCLALSTNAKVLKLDNDVLLILTESEEIHGMDCHCINLINFTSISVTELLIPGSWWRFTLRHTQLPLETSGVVGSVVNLILRFLLSVRTRAGAGCYLLVIDFSSTVDIFVWYSRGFCMSLSNFHSLVHLLSCFEKVCKSTH